MKFSSFSLCVFLISISTSSLVPVVQAQWGNGGGGYSGGGGGYYSYPTHRPTNSPTVGNGAWGGWPVDTTSHPTGAPTTKAPSRSPTNHPTKVPSPYPTKALTAQPSAQDEPKPALQFSGSVQIDANLQLNFQADTVAETLSVELILDGQAWLAVGLTDSGSMVGAIPVLGLPDEATAEKYYLTSRSQDGVNPVEAQAQTLLDTSIVQTDTQTILRYTRSFQDEGDLDVDVSTGELRFIYAYGADNTLGYHGGARGNVIVDLVAAGSGDDQEPSEAPTPAPADEFAGSFSGSVQIDGKLILNFEGDAEEETLSVELILEDQAWLAVGLTNNGRMVGATPVVGLPDELIAEKYFLASTSIDGSGVNPVDQQDQTLLDASVVQNDTHTVLRYTRAFVEEGDLPVDASTGELRFIYAYGTDNSLGYHGSTRGDVTVDLVTGNAELAVGVDTQSKWQAHGIFMGLAWGVFVPLAIGSSLLRNTLPLPAGGWFKLHMFSNLAAFVFTVIGFGLAVSAIMDEQGDNAKHFSLKTHHTIGLIVFVFAVLQVTSGLLRPHAPHAPAPATNHKEVVVEVEDEEEATNRPSSSSPPELIKTTARFLWEIQHRLLGAAALVLALANCHTGINLLTDRYGYEQNWTAVFWSVLGCLCAAMYLSRFLPKQQS